MCQQPSDDLDGCEVCGSITSHIDDEGNALCEQCYAALDAEYQDESRRLDAAE